MCLEFVEEISLESIKAWKLFLINNGKLESLFVNARASVDKVVPYETNKKLKAFPETATFHAFEKFEDAFFLATEDAKSTPKIILPVTLYDVVGKGRYKHRSNDAQCLNGYYPAYQGKEIVVHDSIETRKVVHRKILSFGLERLRYSVLSNMELQSLKFLTGIGA